MRFFEVKNRAISLLVAWPMLLIARHKYEVKDLFLKEEAEKLPSWWWKVFNWQDTKQHENLRRGLNLSQPS